MIRKGMKFQFHGSTAEGVVLSANALNISYKWSHDTEREYNMSAKHFQKLAVPLV